MAIASQSTTTPLPRDPEKAESVVKQGAWLLLATYGYFAVNLVLQPVITRLLSPTIVGTYASIAAIRDIVASFLAFPVGVAFILSSGQPEDWDAAWAIAAVSSIAFAATAVVGLTTFWLLKSPESGILFFLLCIIQTATPFVVLRQSDLQRALQFKTLGFVTNAASLLAALLTLAACYLFRNVWCLALREAAQATITLAALKSVTAQRRKKRPQVSALKKLFGIAWKTQITRIAEIGFTRIPLALIGALFGSATTGQYYIASYTAALPNTAAGPVTENIALSVYARTGEQHATVAVTSTVLSYLLTPFCITLYFCGPELVRFAFGSAWTTAGYILQLLWPYALCLPIFANLKSFAYAIHLQHAVTAAYVAGLMITTLGISTASLLHSETGIAYAGAAGMFVATASLLTGFYVNKVPQTWTILRAAASPVAPGIIATIAVLVGGNRLAGYARPATAIALWLTAACAFNRVALNEIIRRIRIAP